MPFLFEAGGQRQQQKRCRENDDDASTKKPPINGSSSLWLVSMSSVVVAAITLGVYNLGHEEYAHYLEFTFNIGTCLITFWFCMDNRFVAELELGQILFGMHRDCNLCRASETEFRIGSSSRKHNLLYSWTHPPPRRPPVRDQSGSLTLADGDGSHCIVSDFVTYDADMTL